MARSFNVVCFLGSVLFLAALGQVRATTVTSRHQYEMQILEEGTLYTEIIEVDPEQGTERFVVPAHNDVDGSTYIHYFPLNLTMRVLDESMTCYLSHLNDGSEAEEVIPPRDFIDTMQHAMFDDDMGDVMTEIDEWSVGQRVDDEDALPPVFQEACAGYSIYWLNRVHEHISISEPDADVPATVDLPSSRVRRGVDLLTPGCSPLNLRARCKVDRRTCAHYKRRYNMFRTCDQVRRGNTRRSTNVCRKIAHIIDRILCCRDCCNNQSEADNFFPYCETMPVFHCGLAGEDDQKRW